MVRFYGFSLDYVEALTMYDFNRLAESMEILEAKEMLRDIKVAVFPTLKKDAKKDFKKSLTKVAYKLEKENKPAHDNKEIARRLGFA